MVKIRKLKLDVLKPHQPDVVEFARHLATVNRNCQVTIDVVEMDDKTETLEIVLEGEAIEFERLVETITGLGGSLHSIDEVTVSHAADENEIL